MTDAACRSEAGELSPVVDRERCEGKADCVRVCPYDVFEIRKLTRAERSDLGLRGKIKGFAHGWMQAFVVRADQCHACGLCVSACPEHAIRLLRAPDRRDPDERL